MKIYHRLINIKMRWIPYILIFPLFVLMFIFFIIPIANTVCISFAKYVSPSIYDMSQITLENYSNIFSTPNYVFTLTRTLRISFLSTLFCLILGFPVAYYMTKLSGTKQKIYMLIYLAPWIINVAVKAFGWIILLSNNGVINSCLLQLNLITKPIQMLYTETSVIVGVVHGCLIFAVLPIFTSLKSIDPNIAQAAANLGATSRQIFFKITLPLAKPGILAGGFIVFATAMSAYTTPLLLGGGRNRVLSYLVYEQSSRLMNWPMGAAVAFVIVVISVVLVMVIQKKFETEKGRRDVM